MMAARRCSTCALNYPVAYMRCHICGGELAYMATADADEDWQQDVARQLAPEKGSELETVVEWRHRELVRAGWDHLDAVTIAARLDIDVHLACQLLVRGCSQRTALEILL